MLSKLSAWHSATWVALPLIVMPIDPKVQCPASKPKPANNPKLATHGFRFGNLPILWVVSMKSCGVVVTDAKILH